jgi:hypothetical protein
MGLYRVFADEQPAGNLSIAQPGGDEPENLQLARGDAKLVQARFVDDERFSGLCRDGDFLDDGGGLFSGEREPQPDAERCKQGGDQRAVDLHRMLDDQEAVLGEFQDNDEHATANAIEQDVADGAAARTGGGFRRQGHERAMISEDCRVGERQSPCENLKGKPSEAKTALIWRTYSMAEVMPSRKTKIHSWGQ